MLAGAGLAQAAGPEQPCCMHEPFAAQNTVPINYIVPVMQRDIKRLCPGCIQAQFSGLDRHFVSIT